MKLSARERLWSDWKVWLKKWPVTGNAQPGACVNVLPRCCQIDRAEQRLRMCRDGRGLDLVSFAKGFLKRPHIFPIFKVVSEYSRLPFKLKVDAFILYWILVSTFVIFLPFFAMNKRGCTDEAENSSFIRMCTFSSVNRNESTDYQYVISSKKSSAYHISFNIKGTFYLSLFFLEWSSLGYFSCYISFGFTIRTVRPQNNHRGFEFNSFFQTCFPLWLILSSAQKSYYKSLYMTTGTINVAKAKWVSNTVDAYW